jgi:hypothetical protein
MSGNITLKIVPRKLQPRKKFKLTEGVNLTASPKTPVLFSTQLQAKKNIPLSLFG